MKEDIKSRIDHCYTLAENGATELAQTGLQLSFEQFCSDPHSSRDPESVLKSIERTSHRIGVNVALQYAEDFYQDGDRIAARGWLKYAKMHAKELGLDITGSISEIKSRYKDRMPLLFRQ